ncbi:MAG: polysaccharide biosynthesis protein [Verrucomicrobia bacterium]|nr:MAG: polysaccharide biosynthesis protein [Verrucomicrobiota bacterium]
MSFFGPISPPVLNEAATPILRLALNRARVVGNFAIVQAVVQMVGFLSGILLIRHLDQREYAYFTIANTMQGTLNTLADIGISVGLVSIGGRVWQDRNRFGQLIKTASNLRRKLGAIAAIVITPILFFMLVKNGAPVPYTFVLIALVLAGLAVQLALGVLGVVPRLLSDIRRIQTIDLAGASARLLVLVALMFLFLNSAVAVAVGSATLLLQYWMLRRYAARVIDLDAPENEEDRRAMQRFIRNLAANAVFFCFQGQITIFLIGFFGRDINSVAEVGALGRLAMVFTVLTNLLSNIFGPAFARCHDPKRLRWQYAIIVGGVTGFSIALIAAAVLFPGAFLFVLGAKYAHLERELVIMVSGAVVGALTGTFWTLNASKAWIAGSWLYIPLTLAAQIALIPVTDFSSVRSVLLFNLLSAVPNLLLNLALSFRGFATLRGKKA